MVEAFYIDAANGVRLPIRSSWAIRSTILHAPSAFIVSRKCAAALTGSPTSCKQGAVRGAGEASFTHADAIDSRSSVCHA